MKGEEDFKFNHEEMNHNKTMEKYKNSPILTSELLYNIGWTLNSLKNRFGSGDIVLFSEVCFSKDMWDAVNYARLWPEVNHPEADHILQEVLGHLGDAHYMIDSLYQRVVDETPTKTQTAYRSITTEVRAALALIRKAIVLIDNYIDGALGGKHDV